MEKVTVFEVKSIDSIDDLKSVGMGWLLDLYDLDELKGGWMLTGNEEEVEPEFVASSRVFRAPVVEVVNNRLYTDEYTVHEKDGFHFITEEEWANH